MSAFIDNLLASRSITVEQADLLLELKNPHLQYEAVMLWRKQPGSDLEEIVRTLKEGVRPDALLNAHGGRERPSVVHIDLNQAFSKVKLKWIAAAGVLFVGAFIWRSVRNWDGQQHEDVSMSPSAPVAVSSPTATPAAPKPEKPAPPTNLRASVDAQTGLVRLTWNVSESSETYRLYAGRRQNLSDMRRVENSEIMSNSYNWMPPENATRMYLAVTRTPEGGVESRLSRPYVYEPPAPEEPAPAAVPQQTAPAASTATPTTSF
jgi:hypothetical protein